MIIEGKDLELVSFGLQLALGEIHNNIVTCPDVVMWARDIAALEKQKAELEELLDRVTKGITEQK